MARFFSLGNKVAGINGHKSLSMALHVWHFLVLYGLYYTLYISDMLPRRTGASNESLDPRQVPQDWDSLAIPCVHFVNYNFEEGFGAGSSTADSPDHGCKAAVMNIEETMAVLTRCSFDEAHRQPIFNLGGIRALAELIQVCKVLKAGASNRTSQTLKRRTNAGVERSLPI